MPLPRLLAPLQKLKCYSCASKIILVGFDEDINQFRLLDIARPAGDAPVGQPLPVQITLHAETFTHEGMRTRLTQLQKELTDLSIVCEDVWAIFGLIKLVESYYLILITEASPVGTISGRFVYSIEKTSMVQISYRAQATKDENRYKSTFGLLDLSKGFYFSYTYDLSNTLQHNMTQTHTSPHILSNDMFVWNAFLLRPLLSKGVAACPWVVPVIHGYFDQRCAGLVGGEMIKITLIGRRSRHFAGCRYLRRGVNEKGYVANEVETEQLVSRELNSSVVGPRYTSMVQMRGSIPLHWAHQNLYSPKPDVVVSDTDPPLYVSTRKHFNRLMDTYGRHVTVLSLLRQEEKKPKEALLGQALSAAIGTLNEMLLSRSILDFSSPEEHPYHNKQLAQDLLLTDPDALGSGDVAIPSESEVEFTAAHDVPDTMPIDYITYDFLNNAKKAKERGTNVFDALAQISETIFPQHGFFVEAGSKGIYRPYPTTEAGSVWPRTHPTPNANGDGVIQLGILRVNCVDCLDRTNVAQFCYARLCISHMVTALGIHLPQQSLGELWRLLMEMWAENGDQMARQYGGSGAMHKVDDTASTVDGEREFVLTGGAKNALVAVQRYYANTLTDYERQQAMDLLLGIFVPMKGERHLWEIRVRPEEYREASNLEHVLAEEDRRESEAEDTLQESLNSILLRRHTAARMGEMFSLFSHDLHQASTITSFESLSFKFAAPVIQDLPYEPWRKVEPAVHRKARSKKGTREEPQGQQAPALSTKVMSEDEEMYSKYIAFEHTFGFHTQTEPLGVPKSISSPRRGAFSEALRQRKAKMVAAKLDKPANPNPNLDDHALSALVDLFLIEEKTSSNEEGLSAVFASDPNPLFKRNSIKRSPSPSSPIASSPRNKTSHDLQRTNSLARLKDKSTTDLLSDPLPIKLSPQMPKKEGTREGTSSPAPASGLGSALTFFPSPVSENKDGSPSSSPNSNPNSNPNSAVDPSYARPRSAEGNPEQESLAKKTFKFFRKLAAENFDSSLVPSLTLSGQARGEEDKSRERKAGDDPAGLGLPTGLLSEAMQRMVTDAVEMKFASHQNKLAADNAKLKKAIGALYRSHQNLIDALQINGLHTQP